MFNIENFMPHGHCYLWREDILFMNVISDVLISLCYMAIPALLLFVVQMRKDIPFKSTLYVFIVFIFFCSLTHIMQIINVWYPLYYFTGVLKVITAVISVISTFIIMKNINKILDLPSLSNIEKRLEVDMRHIMQKLPIGIIFSDKKGRINYHNEYVNQTFNYSQEELMNQDVEMLIENSLHVKHRNYKNEYLNSPSEKTMGEGRVLSGITKDGEQKYLEIGLRPLVFESNNKDMLLVAIKDITAEEKQKRKIAETLKLVHVATYGMPSLLSYVNRKGIYKYVNESYTRKWNLSSSDILEKHYLEFLPENTARMITDKMQKALSGEEVNFKITVDFPKEGLRELDVFYKPHSANNSSEVEGVVVLAHDITDLNQTLLKLEVSNKQLEEYAFLVSHDLRAPVRHISNFVELLVEQISSNEPNNEKIEKYTNIIKTNSTKIQNMISGMLKIASLNQVKPSSNNIELNQYFIKQQKFYSDSVKININTPISLPIEINTDKDLLDSVFNNLITNSINFVDGKVIIDIFIERKLDKIIITYTDNGTGIEQKLAKTIFNPFIKAEESKGLGLGMTIVSRSLEKINGKIRCIPSGEGAIFEIEL